MTAADEHLKSTAIDNQAVADELRTERLLLRRWKPSDEAEMTRINRHPEVGRYLNRPVDDDALAAFYGLITDHWHRHGYGPWALESVEGDSSGQFLGFAGLAHVPPFLAAAGPAPELGWRLDPVFWGRGLATEAAIAARDHALGPLGLPQLISIIHPDNDRSRRVAVKLGMHRERQIHNPAIDRDVDVWTLSAVDLQGSIR
jgi:RimJ/RimL family protein N-acetyltransferase